MVLQLPWADAILTLTVLSLLEAPRVRGFLLEREGSDGRPRRLRCGVGLENLEGVARR